MSDFMHKVFFALWPDQDLREQLASLQQPVRQGRLVPVENLHLTLHYVGLVDALGCLLEEAGKIRFSPGSFRLERYGVFRKARVLWVGPAQWPEELSELASACRDAAGTCGYAANSERFQPHVTLARKVSRLPDLPAFEPVEWTFRSFSLVESVSTDRGVRYKVLRTFNA